MNIIRRMETHILIRGKMILFTDQDNLNGMMVEYSWVNGKIILFMVKEFTNGVMAKYM